MIMLGKVVLYDPKAGWGFIRPVEGGEDVFVGGDVLKRSGIATLLTCQDVAFEIDADRITTLSLAGSETPPTAEGETE